MQARFLIPVLVSALAALAPLAAQEITAAGIATPLKLERLDPALNRLLRPDSRLEEIGHGYKLQEGPLWLDNSLLFADLILNKIDRWTPGKGISTVLEPSGYVGPLAIPEPGLNGLTLDAQGRITVAGHATRQILRWETHDLKGPSTVLADRYQGHRLNSPNDVVYTSDGAAWFTDPPYGLLTQANGDAAQELHVDGVYRIPHALAQLPGTEPARDQLQLVISDLTGPNGLAFSPDEKFLWVSNSSPKKLWMRYRVNLDGSVSEPTLIADATSDPRPGHPDGMKFDTQGNLYSAGPGGVWIFSPTGKHLGTILIPEICSNVAWDGDGGDWLFITTLGKLYRVQLNAHGATGIKK